MTSPSGWRRFARVDRISPLYQCSLRDIVFRNGNLQHRIEQARAEPATAVLARAGLRQLAVKGISGRLFGKSKYARMAFGAQFARVAVNASTGSVRVTHMTGAFAGGRILNARTARSQLLGGMVWGVGHALMEESLRDVHDGRMGQRKPRRSARAHQRRRPGDRHPDDPRR